MQTLAQGLPVVEQLSLAYNELSDLEVRNHIRGQGGGERGGGRVGILCLIFCFHHCFLVPFILCYALCILRLLVCDIIIIYP